MIKLVDILKEAESILVPRRSREERNKARAIVDQKKVLEYIKNGSKGDLDLLNSPLTSLPSTLKKVGGDLELAYSQIESLPEGLVIEGHLYTQECALKSLPNNLIVKGDISISLTEHIQSLPQGLKVGGTLDCSGLEGFELIHPGLEVGGEALFYDCPDIDKIPNGYKIGSDLNLDSTNIESLPKDLQVGGDITLTNTPLSDKYTFGRVRKMCPGLKGDIYLD